MENLPHVVPFNQVDSDDVNLVGGKGANLGEMTKAGFPVPSGFIVTSPAYFYVLDENNLRPKIKDALVGLNVQNSKALKISSRKIKRLISHAEIPDDLAKEIITHYRSLERKTREPWVAIRSSATAEDLPVASFAGQQETFLNIKGTANVVHTVRRAWASLFEPRAIFYRQEKGFDHLKVGIAVPVQKMIQSDVSGVMFTVDPISEDKDRLVIEAVWGLGEMIVQGAVTPDRYLVEKNKVTILQKINNDQTIELKRVGRKNKKIHVAEQKQKKLKLTDEQIVRVAKLGNAVHQHYFYPQDIEWALENGHLYLLQTRPITTLDTEKKKKTKIIIDGATFTKNLKIILNGDPASPGIHSGRVRIIHSAKEISKVKTGDVLVTEMTTPDFVPVMRRVVAIVTDRGGQTSHAAIVSRELGITCVVGTKQATKKLKNGHMITVNGKTGEIFAGSLPPRKLNQIESVQTASRLQSSRKTATKIYVNLAEPDRAHDLASRNVDGIGLLRAEFMIAQIGIHPKKLLQDKKRNVFVRKLADGLETFCRAFDPRPVVYRTTDFKTNEYRNLIGGKNYEPEEENPLIGYRGAYRYVSDETVFDMELDAIKRVRNKGGYKNLWMMVPFVRNVPEFEKVKRIIASKGLVRSATFKLWMMVEIPSNVILLDDFIDVGIDGVSIGTNDLTMLTLGVDRDNQEISQDFDERNPAMLWSLKRIITTASKRGITSSVCGQAPSSYPDLTQKLVEWGITSVSVSPDVIDATREIIYHSEIRMLNRKKRL